MSIWFQLPIESTQEDCQQECNMINTSYLLTTLMYNGSETVDIAVNRTSVLVIVDGELRASEQSLLLNS